MSVSKVDICNSALGLLGADRIRSVDEDNKRARMCDRFYESAKAYLLARFDWPFAKKLKKLQPLAVDEDDQIEGRYEYALPSDCITPRDLYPPGGRNWWEIMGKTLICRVSPDSDTEVILMYTGRVEDVTYFTDTFVNLLALSIAVRIAPSITQDEALAKSLYGQYQTELRDAWESDANVGNDYRAYNEDPNNDSFVYPDGVYPTDQYDPWS